MCAICNLVPLSSLGTSRLRISSTSTPTFNLGLSEDAPDNSKKLKSSTVENNEFDMMSPTLCPFLGFKLQLCQFSSGSDRFGSFAVKE
ncbi:hypothetical protein AVEN_179486-1 [Araneus ventricosus]|uniref:Uncharacterized protein n=1 Tax=Araneus ventricosus TaxID=182803 RepID=A0A4Y2BED6_ARAVE|nr:hypothetical protein AVEN_179486-1 [Araneus ventricosus]